MPSTAGDIGIQERRPRAEHEYWDITEIFRGHPRPVNSIGTPAVARDDGSEAKPTTTGRIASRRPIDPKRGHRADFMVVERVQLVTSMRYDLAFFDDETGRIERSAFVEAQV